MDLTNHPARLPIERLLKNCEVKRTRASGPGGQHRNKVETAIVITHLPSGAVGQASEKRSQERNRVAAIDRLRINLALEIRSEVPVEPSELWQSRVKGKKISINPGHSDFPALLAEGLDCVFDCGFEVREAAEQLGVSTSQLVKFIKLNNGAFELVNRERVASGMKKLN